MVPRHLVRLGQTEGNVLPQSVQTPALINRGVPVAMVTTPQYFTSQRSVEINTGWTSEPLDGRIGHYERLYELSAEGNPIAPLTLDDLRGVARSRSFRSEERRVGKEC